jgi:hypothetical protein
MPRPGHIKQTFAFPLSCLPAFRIAPAVEAGDYHNPMLLNLEEYSVRKAPYSGTPPSPVDDSELQRAFCDCLDGCLYSIARNVPRALGVCSRTTHVLLSTPRPLPVSRRPAASRFFEQARPDLLPSDDIGGFCSCRAMRSSSSARCASVSDGASASRLSHTASSNSAFSAAERLSI